jgi:hypothetical protein
MPNVSLLFGLSLVDLADMTFGTLAANIATLGCLIADYPIGIFIPQIDSAIW